MFLLVDTLEALFGGAAGGGKSNGLLMAALQYVNVPKYRAILFRRSYADLSLPGALIDISHEWLSGTDAVWKAKEHYWLFPKYGSTLGFGYMDAPNDIFRYQSAQFSFVGFDELTQFTERQYRYLFSRLRRPRCPIHAEESSPTCKVCRRYAPLASVPLRMRAATNPGDVGHEWVKYRFIDYGNSESRVFIPSRISDNPYLDADEYRRSLSNLDPITRRQLEEGDWEARTDGGYFFVENFSMTDTTTLHPRKRVRFWDLASTRLSSANNDPDYTAGVKMSIDSEGLVYVEDVRRCRGSPLEVENLIRLTAEIDGREVEIGMEREGGASGVALVDHYMRKVLAGYWYTPMKATGSKEVRARPFSAYAQNGSVRLLRGRWNMEYLDELGGFPCGGHDDQVDASSGAFSMLTTAKDLEFLESTLILTEGDLNEL